MIVKKKKIRARKEGRIFPLHSAFSGGSIVKINWLCMVLLSSVFRP